MLSLKYESEKKKVEDLFQELLQLYKDKNEDYGCSYIKAGEIFAKIFDKPIVIKNEKDFITFGILTRKLDKFVRACNLLFGNDNKVAESASETLADDGVYSIMLASLLKTSHGYIDDSPQSNIVSEDDIEVEKNKIDDYLKTGEMFYQR